ncbi:hypothetical protein ABG067_008084, partial [Albugo candida]
ARRGAVAKGFQHGEERPLARRRDRLEQRAERRTAGRCRDDALILEKAAPTIEPVPAADRIERIKDAAIVCVATALPQRPGAIIGAIEQFERHRIERTVDAVGQHGERRRSVRDPQVVVLAPIRGSDDPAPERRAARGAIDPGDGVLVPRDAALDRVAHRVEAGARDRFERETGRADPLQLQLDLDDDPRQPQPPDRRGEQIGVTLGRRLDPPVGARDDQATDMMAERPCTRVVLAVHVVRDRTPDRDV